MTLYELDPLEDPRWAQLVESDPRASVFHTLGWLTALQRTYGYTPTAVTSSSPGVSLQEGAVFCKVESWLTGRRMVSLPFSDHCDPLVSDAMSAKSLEGWCTEQKRQGWKYVEIRPRSAIQPDLEANGAFSPAAQFFLHTLDLKPRLEDVLKSFHKSSVQRRIRRAEREGMQYHAGRSEDLVRQFHRLHVRARRRHMVPPQPLAWFLNLAKLLGEKLQIRSLSYRGRPVASLITLQHGKSMIYKYGCSDPQLQNLGGMPLLLWRSIREAKEQGMDEFDFGRTDRQHTGLVRFKDRWGTSRAALTYWRCSSSGVESAGARVQAAFMPLAKKMLARSPDFVFRFAGKLLYRHTA